MITRFAQTFFWSMCFKKPATGVSRPSLKDAKRWHYMQMLFIISQAAQILPWLGCCSPQQLPSKVYAQGFLISSLRAAVSAAVFTTAVGKLNTNLEGSICCPGGLRDRLILCISHYKTLCSLPRAALHSSVDGEGKVAKAMNGAHHWLCIYGLPSFKNIAFQIDLMPKKLVQRRSGKL